MYECLLLVSVVSVAVTGVAAFVVFLVVVVVVYFVVKRTNQKRWVQTVMFCCYAIRVVVVLGVFECVFMSLCLCIFGKMGWVGEVCDGVTCL